MKKLYLMAMCWLAGSMAHAQCTNGRYWNEIFPSVSMSTVTYSTAYGLQMDIYQPAGDTLSARPVIILGHGGSFITGNGDRTNDTTILKLCQRFAMRGYVTVSIDYRTVDYLTVLDSAAMVDEVIKAIGDGKAAIRFFMNDRATTNTYKIDTNNIYIGGNSAGAVLYMHVGYLDSIGECPANIAAAMTANGGFEGNSGFPGYSTRSRAIINLAGALNETSFVGPGDKPSVNAQGTADNIVPYNCGYPLTGVVHVNLCGLGMLEPAYVSKGIYHMSHIFPGDNHVPWASDTVKFNTVDSLVRVFLFNFVCPGVVINEVHEVASAAAAILFPNPASGSFTVDAPALMSGIAAYDQTGRQVFSANGLNNRQAEINTSAWGRGVYFIRIVFAGSERSPEVKRVVVD